MLLRAQGEGRELSTAYSRVEVMGDPDKSSYGKVVRVEAWLVRVRAWEKGNS